MDDLKPFPDRHIRIPYKCCFTADEFSWMSRGSVPESMDDKWLVKYDAPWMSFYRSWTGDCIFKVRFVQKRDAACIAEVLVSREPGQYNSDNPFHDSALVRRMLEALVDGELAPP